MSEATLQKIYTGVDGMIIKQKEQDSRLADVESAVRSRKTAGIGGGSSDANTDPAGYILKMAAALVYLKEGHTDGFERAGISTPEKKLILDVTRKAMDTGSGGAGGGLVVPQDYIAALIEMLRAKMVVVQAGATLMENLTGSPVIVPKQLTSASGAWIGQNSTIALSDPSFGQVSLTPKTYAIRAQFSNLLNLLSNPAMEQIVRRDFAKICGLEMDRVALRGSGASNQPLGVNGVSGLGTYAIGTNGGDLTRQDLLKMVGVAEDQNALDGKLAFVMNPKVCRVLKNERIAQFSGQTVGEYIQYPLSNAALAKSLDYPVFTTTQLPVNLTKGSSTDCSEVYFGNWEELLIGMWGSLEILATNIGGNAWTQNAIEVRLVFNCDVQVRHAASFVLCNDARTNNA